MVTDSPLSGLSQGRGNQGKRSNGLKERKAPLPHMCPANRGVRLTAQSLGNQRFLPFQPRNGFLVLPKLGVGVFQPSAVAWLTPTTPPSFCQHSIVGTKTLLVSAMRLSFRQSPSHATFSPCLVSYTWMFRVRLSNRWCSGFSAARWETFY